MSDRLRPRFVGVVLFAAIGALFAVLLGIGLASPAHAVGDEANPPGTVLGTTQGWFDGTTVTFFYTRDFFCTQPPTSAAASDCEVGAAAETAPVANPDLPEVWVLVPLFTPNDPETFKSTLQCPVAGNCVAHPHDIDLSRIGLPADVPTPAHSHVIDDLQGGWWESFVVGVKTEAAWDAIVAGKSLATIRALQAADPAENTITHDIPSNLFLFFNVLPAR